MIFVGLVGIQKLMNKEEKNKRKLVMNRITCTHIPRLTLSASRVEKADVYRLIRFDLLVAKEI